MHGQKSTAIKESADNTIESSRRNGGILHSIAKREEKITPNSPGLTRTCEIGREGRTGLNLFRDRTRNQFIIARRRQILPFLSLLRGEERLTF